LEFTVAGKTESSTYYMTDRLDKLKQNVTANCFCAGHHVISNRWNYGRSVFFIKRPWRCLHFHTFCFLILESST